MTPNTHQDWPVDHYINRELSWLAFNLRVFEEAKNTHHPLLERIKFLSISASNLDEFMMVRVAGLKDQLSNHIKKTSVDGLTTEEQLEKISERVKKLRHDQQRCFESLKLELHKAGIAIQSIDSLSESEKLWLEEYFDHNIFPALSPIAIDPAHPFPFLPNLGLAILFHVLDKQKDQELLTVVLLPEVLPRFIRVGEQGSTLVTLEELVYYFCYKLFPQKKIMDYGILRVIRDSEIEIEDEAEDLMRHFESAVKRRRRGSVIYIEPDEQLSHSKTQLLPAVITHLGLSESEIANPTRMLGLRHVIELYALPFPDLKFEPYTERFPERINDYHGDCFAAIAAKDLVIHHPYETFDVVVNFLQQAAKDPGVIAIKQTLYRTSSDSPIVKALIEAAEAGKSVTVVVELKARFDEESNIRWAKDLERVGAQVVFGFVDLKTHAKISLVVRRQQNQLVTYAHFGTGNYHPETARTYSDLSFFTCRADICNDAALLFNYLTGYSMPKHFEKLVVSPVKLRSTVMQLIDDEITHAKAGRPANMIAKMNALVDPEVIEKLYEASQAGVQIDLIVRGICCLRPQVKGLSENIRVKSMIGRFLEHARIYCFGAGHVIPSEKAKLFISSADWMSRNFNNRVELMIPIENPTVHEQILNQILLVNLQDQKQSWEMQSDGSYVRINHDARSFCAHDYFMTNPSLSGRGKSLSKMQAMKQRQKVKKLLRNKRARSRLIKAILKRRKKNRTN